MKATVTAMGARRPTSSLPSQENRKEKRGERRRGLQPSLGVEEASPGLKGSSFFYNNFICWPTGWLGPNLIQPMGYRGQVKKLNYINGP